MKRPVAILAVSGLALLGSVATAQTASAFPCNYQISQTQCSTYWQPGPDTCAGVGQYGTSSQIAQCLAWIGYGSRG
jgi:hypothetical protein